MIWVCISVATLMFVTGENAIHHLFSRNTHLELYYPTLCTVLPIYFLMACWAAGTSISSGLVVPMLYVSGPPHFQMCLLSAWFLSLCVATPNHFLTSHRTITSTIFHFAPQEHTDFLPNYFFPHFWSLLFIWHQ